MDPFSILYQVVQRGQWCEVVFGEDEIVFEPKFEQIAQNVKIRQTGPDVVKKLHKHLTAMTLVGTDVSVAYEDVHCFNNGLFC